MKAKILILLAIVVMFYNCNKDTYTTKPQIKVKSLSSTRLSSGDLLLIQLEFTDAEGDIQDSLYIQKVSKACPGTSSEFKVGYPVPDFTPTSNLKGVLELNYAYNVNINGYKTITGCGNRNDTTYFRFWLIDKAKNVSDTITSDNIVLLK